MKTADPLREGVWYLAATLKERIAAAVERRRDLRPPGGQGKSLAARRLARWRSQAPFENEELFARRLALDGLSEDQVLAHLAIEPVDLASLFAAPLPWQARFMEAFSTEARHEHEPLPPPIDLEDRPEADFLKLADPWMDRARRRLLKDALQLVEPQAEQDRLFDPRTVDRLLLSELPGRLLRRMIRVLTMELNVARLEERLVGETPAERFRSFVDPLAERARALEILREYPVLARQLTVDVEQWTASSLELLQALVRDAGAIRAGFPEPGVVQRVEARVGDPHRGGRSVKIVHFSSGLRWVYKPRSMAVDSHFQSLLTWMNDRGLEPRLKVLAVLDRGDYGWMEFAAARPCASRDELRRFYLRQGAYLA